MEAEKNQQQNHHDSHKKAGPIGIRHLVAVWIGKTLIALTRILGRGGTTLPGRAALAMAPGLSYVLAGRLSRGTIVVTGTNGKTTTAALIDGILEEAGFKCIHNQSGSNMSWGVASTLIEHSSWTGQMDADIGVMEVDEGAFPGVTAGLQPLGVVVTNIFRDQLDRFGEIDSIRDLIQKGIDAFPPGSFQVLNADDPSLAALTSGKDVKRWTFGLELELPPDEFLNTGRDIKTCPVCSHKLEYTRFYFAHIGHYQCPSCNYQRPEPDLKLTSCSAGNEGFNRIRISLPEQKLEAELALPGLYNLYNALAAVTCARALGIPGPLISRALKKATPSFGRMERFEKEGREIVMALIKNPVGANEVLRTLLNQPGTINLVVAINDRIADGTDVSWLWDVDFDQLAGAKSRFTKIIASGRRAWDMAVRFKYAGFKPEQILVVEDTGRAIEEALEQTGTGSELFILPTYTAMLEMRGHLNKMGLGSPYWEGS